jgi:peptidoglycan DL-endopeptidase CwlO
MPDWIELALSQQGKPYIWGSGSGAGGRGRQHIGANGQPDGYDCSGFVSWVLKESAGIDLPAYTGTAYPATRALRPDEQPRPGDVVFYNMNVGDPRKQHIALYLGDDKIVQSGGRGNNVNVDDVDSVGRPEYRRVVTKSPEQERLLTDPAYASFNAAGQSAGLNNRGARGSSTPINSGASAAWGAAAPYISHLVDAATKYQVPVNVLAGLLIQESGGNPRAVSKAGAQGLMQFMPGTARGMGIDPFDPAQAIDGGARYLKQLADQSGGDWSAAVGKYNAGPAGNLNNAETRNHITKVMGHAENIATGWEGGADAMPTAPQPNPYRGSDRGGPGGGPTVGDVQRGLSSLFDRIKSWGGNVQVSSGQRRAGGGTPTYPGVPGLEGITSGGGGGPGGPGGGGREGDGQITLSVEEIKAALAKGGGAITELLGRVLNENVESARTVRAPLVRQGQPTTGMRTDPGFIAGIEGQEARDQPGPAGVSPAPGGGPGAPTARPRPQGWIDPASISSNIYRGVVEISNGLLEQIDADQERLDQLVKENKPESILERQQLQSRITAAQTRIVSLAPQLRLMEQEEAAGREGTVAPGATPYMTKIPIYKKVDGKWQIEYIDNPNASEDPSIARQRMSEEGATTRNLQDIASRERISGQELGVRREEMRSREGIAGLQEAGAIERANIAANTQRVTTALAQAVEQRRQDIDAQIRAGDLDLRTATEQFNQWYKQNVEAPIAILRTQQETANYRLNQERAVTERASAQAEHERGIANIGQQMWGQAAQAYNQMIPLTVGQGWGEGFQKNLQGQGFTPNQGATYNVPESLDQFATRKVAEMLKGVSPYAQSLLTAGQQMGTDGSAPMSGAALQGLTDQAAGVAGNALANPFQMPQQKPFELPPSVDVAGISGAGMQNGQQLTNQLDQYIPTYEYGLSNAG